MKMAPVVAALRRPESTVTLVHTGQHYDPPLSKVLFGQLGMSAPDVNLTVRSVSHAGQRPALTVRL